MGDFWFSWIPFILMFIPETISKKHHLNPFFTSHILLAMARILQTRKNFDLEHWEKYFKELWDDELSRRIEAVEKLIETPEGQEKLLKKMEDKWNSAEWQFAKLAESIHSWELKKEHLARFAKQEDITWETFLNILKEENPQLDAEKFTEDCREYLDEEPNLLLEKLLNS